MKKKVVVCTLALGLSLLALAGCASAGDTAAASEAAPAESTAESAAAEDSTEAALPGEPHPLSAYSACAVSGNCVYAAVTHFSSSEDSLGSFDHSTKPTLPPGRPMRCTARTPNLRPRR